MTQIPEQQSRFPSFYERQGVCVPGRSALCSISYRDPNRLQFKIINITKYSNGFQDCYWKNTYLNSTVFLPIFSNLGLCSGI